LFGLSLSAMAALAFGFAYWLAVRPNTGWLDGQWLFLAALPYTWTLLQLRGAVDFSPDAPLEVVAALAFDVALAYLAGAVFGTLARQLRRLALRSRA
jgi:hypothetical protein